MSQECATRERLCVRENPVVEESAQAVEHRFSCTSKSLEQGRGAAVQRKGAVGAHAAERRGGVPQGSGGTRHRC